MRSEPLLHAVGSLSVLRRLVPRSYRREIDATAEAVPFEMAAGIRFRVHPQTLRTFEEYVSAHLPCVEEMRAFVRLTAGRKTLLDVGARYGEFSLTFASRPGTIAVAVDPSPPAQQMLRYHARANPDLDLRPVEIALADSSGRLAMAYVKDHLVSVAASRPVAGLRRSVEVTTIDALVARLGLRFDTLKIDVEGFELRVLRGAERWMLESDPLVFLEVHPDFCESYGDSVEDLVTLLDVRGYRLFDATLEPISDPATFFNAPLPEHRLLTRQVRRVICARADPAQPAGDGPARA
jgi:FkbM family methyltransferase